VFLLLILFSQVGVFSLGQKDPRREAVALRCGCLRGPAREHPRGVKRAKACKGASAWQQAGEGLQGGIRVAAGGRRPARGHPRGSKRTEACKGSIAWQQAGKGLQRRGT